MSCEEKGALNFIMMKASVESSSLRKAAEAGYINNPHVFSTLTEKNGKLPNNKRRVVC